MILLFVVYFLFSVGGLTLYKVGTGYTPVAWVQSLCGLKISWLSVGGLLCYGVSFITYLVLVSKSELSFLYPLITGISSILILAVSAIVLRESIHPLNWLGVGVILVGIFLVSYGRH